MRPVRVEQITPAMKVEQHEDWAEISGQLGTVSIRLVIDPRPAMETLRYMAMNSRDR